MRILADLYSILIGQKDFTPVSNDAYDMFRRQNFASLRVAIDCYTVKEDDTIRACLKRNIYYFSKKAVSILQGLMLEEGNNALVSDLRKFVSLLDLWGDIIFEDAVYETNKRRETVLQKPEKLPDEGDVRKIRAHILSRMKALVNKNNFFTSNDFVELRDAVPARLIILNGRRDSEPSRLSLSDWEVAKNDVWVGKDNLNVLDLFDKAIVKSVKITYITGKGMNSAIFFPKFI